MTAADRAGRLSGKTALLIGGGQAPGPAVGMGRAAAITYAREGATVAVADRDPGAARATADEIVAEGGRAIAVEVDITDESSIVAMVGRVGGELGRIDVLHNNVGISIGAGDTVVTEIDLDVFDAITAVNLRGMVATCKHVIPVMRAQGAGSIVSIGSTAPLTHYPQISYKTSKAGVVALTENIAWVHAPDGIRANAVLPGLVDTPMAIDTRVGIDGATREQLVAERAARVPLGGRIGTAWDVAKAALFFASDDAAFVTGRTLVVDGGQTLRVG